MTPSGSRILTRKWTSLSPGGRKTLLRLAEALLHLETPDFGDPRSPIPLARPDITHAEFEAVLSVLAGPQLSLGPKLGDFERAIARYAGVRHAIAVNSGTSGLHLILQGLGIGPGDEVVTTPFSFIASANCILFVGARPVFADIDPETYNIDPREVVRRITPRTKAILAVDVFGRPADWDELRRIARRRRLLLIEDSAEALGSRYRGRMAGSLGDAGVYAFYPNKQITTGEGGVVLTDRRDLAEACASLRNQGHDKSSSWLEHPRLGYNYRLSDINCALGIAQLGRIDAIIRKRARVAAWYDEELAGVPGLRLPEPDPPGVRTNRFVYVVRLDDALSSPDRARIMRGLRSLGIGCREYFPVIHLQKFYREEHGCRPGSYPIAEHVAERTLALPFHNNLSREDVRRVARAMTSLLRP